MHVIQDVTECEAFFAEKKSLSFKVAGFDCEWTNGRHVSLLQLAFPNKECVLVRLSHINHIPRSLTEFLIDARCEISLCVCLVCFVY